MEMFQCLNVARAVHGLQRQDVIDNGGLFVCLFVCLFVN